MIKLVPEGGKIPKLYGFVEHSYSSYLGVCSTYALFPFNFVVRLYRWCWWKCMSPKRRKTFDVTGRWHAHHDGYKKGYLKACREIQESAYKNGIKDGYKLCHTVIDMMIGGKTDKEIRQSLTIKCPKSMSV